VLGKIFPVL